MTTERHLQALLRSLCDNLPGLIISLLDSYVIVAPQLPLSGHRSFIAVLLKIPGIPALNALASHLSLVKSASGKVDPSASYGSERRTTSFSTTSSNTELLISQRKASVLVQSVLSQFIAHALTARISAEPVRIASILPEGSTTAGAELASHSEVLLPDCNTAPIPLRSRSMPTQLTTNCSLQTILP